MDHHLPRNPTTAYILIADSGLEQSGHGVFPRELFAAFTGNWEDFADQMRPIVTDAEAISHGTEVASVALGGPTFAFTQAYSEEPRVKLLVQRIYQQSGSDVINDTDLFQDVVQHAGDFSGTIVNVSLRSTAKIPAIATEADNSKSSLLFVVAAGNQGKELDPEGAPKEATYPALYGGDARARLITVAALDAKAKLWAHSNWSPLLVDIAAPGCYIPVITASANSTRFRDDVRSGTSLAAPLVSFAAALVRSETSMSGDRLKRRILVSADLTPGDLSTKVIDGRRLDIAKAVAVTTDIVETKDGLHFGTARFFQGPTELHDGQKLGLKCQKVSNLTLKVESLLKFARYGGTTADPRFRIYYRKDGDPNPNALFESDLCTLPTDWLIKFSDYPDGIQRTVDFLSLIDYVERHRN
jgi:subtilisin family serine protease